MRFTNTRQKLSPTNPLLFLEKNCDGTTHPIYNNILLNLNMRYLLSRTRTYFCVVLAIAFLVVAVPVQQPIVQTCTEGAACVRCTDMNTVIINNGRVVTSNVRRVLNGRYNEDKDDATAKIDVCCSNCQPIIGDANTQAEDTDNAACAITCDFSQNDQNVANLANLGSISGANGYSTAFNFNPYNSLGGSAGFGGLNGLGGLVGLGGFNLAGLNRFGANSILFDSPTDEVNT